MNPSEILKFITEHISDWVRISLLTLMNPIARFKLVPIGEEGTASVIGPVETDRKLWLHPKLLSYTIFSIILGILINALIPGRKSGPDLLASVIIIFIYWILKGSLVHIFCLILQGKGKYIETLSVIFQVYATIYVMTSFLAFIVSPFLVNSQIAYVSKNIPIFGNVTIEFPVIIYFIIGIILGMIYVPLAMKPVHKFSPARTAILMISPLLTVWIAIAIYWYSGILIGSGGQ